MKQASNSFTGGLVTDLHPLMSDKTQLTDALNATLVTFNGNEMMLQNEMGNTLIQDSATGNIMGLSPGFIPVGLKEHGGIMYIASVNKAGEGEIGTIPSPIIRDFYKRKNTYQVNQNIPINSGLVQISNKIYPKDKFMANLQLSFGKTDNDGNLEYYGDAIIGNQYWKNSFLSQDLGNPSYDPSDLIVERKVITTDNTPLLELTDPNVPNGVLAITTAESTMPEQLYIYGDNYTLNGYMRSEFIEKQEFDVYLQEPDYYYECGIKNSDTGNILSGQGMQFSLFGENGQNLKAEFEFTMTVTSFGESIVVTVDLKEDPSNVDQYIDKYNSFTIPANSEFPIRVIGYPFNSQSSKVQIKPEYHLSGNGELHWGMYNISFSRHSERAFNDTTFDGELRSLYTPLISYSEPLEYIDIVGEEEPIKLFSNKGIYRMNLYSCGQNLSVEAAPSLLTPQQYEFEGNIYTSKYWFTHYQYPNNLFPKDLLNVTLNGGFKSFPTTYKPGYLAVRLNVESPADNFNMLPRKIDPVDTPITVKWFDAELGDTYYSYFSGFYYRTQSGLYIDRLKNITVTNETTNQQVPLLLYDNPEDVSTSIDCYYFNQIGDSDTQPEYVYDYGLNVKFLNTSLETGYDRLNVLYKQIDGGLFQKQSADDDCVFLLTSVSNINTHRQTELESSTVGIDEKPHPGLFCAQIGGNTSYKDWHRLDLDYYDQYDNFQGHFSLKFNPFLNDVFGTNTGLKEVEQSNFYTIGKKVTFSATSATSITFTPTETDAAQATCPVPRQNISNTPAHHFDSPNITQYGNKAPNMFQSAYDGETIFSRKSTVLTAGYKCDSEVLNTFKEQLNKYIPEEYRNVPHIYGPNYLQSTIDGVELEGEVRYKYSTISKEGDLPEYIQLGWWDTGWQSAGKAHYTTKTPSQIIAYADAMYKEDTKIQLYKNASFTETTDFYFANTDSNNILNTIYFQDPDFENPEDNKKLFTINNNSIEGFWKSAPFNSLLPTINVSIREYRSNADAYTWDLHSGTFGTQERKHIGYLNSFKKDTQLKLSHMFELPSVTLSLVESVTFDPKYEVSPYFLLKESESEYISLLSDVPYLCNFEIGADGRPYDYVHYSVSADEGIDSKIPLSYTVDESVALNFRVFDTDIDIKESLDAGIYVFYIQKCTCNLSNNDPISLDITVNETKYQLPVCATTVEIIKDGSTVDIENSGDGNGEEINIYMPYVIIVPNTTDVLINASGYKYTSYGLFRLTAVPDEDIKGLLLNSEGNTQYVYSHLDYMKKIVENASKLESGVLTYNYIQKLGVFFRSCYSFMDGKYKNGKIEALSNPYTEETSNFVSGPFIPNNSYTLPVQVIITDENEAYYRLQGYLRDNIYLPNSPSVSVTVIKNIS